MEWRERDPYMTRRILIDGRPSEETRVVLLNGDHIEHFDFETHARKQIKGNVYLARVTRVEPSLQAAFVEYGGNKHGFLAFDEIHPDYFRIPTADREAIIDEEIAAAKEQESDDDEAVPSRKADKGSEQPRIVEAEGDAAGDASGDASGDERPDDDGGNDDDADDDSDGDGEEARDNKRRSDDDIEADEERLQQAHRRAMRRATRKYKIQEVLVGKQILLVQVVKEQRGNKGAALTTYLSLAGRYCVLMPNSIRQGGVSRKISSAADRKRLKDIVGGLDLPEGQSVIMRTAGAKRTKADIVKDYDFLSKLWFEIRERTLKSTAPSIIHEEGDIIKRSIRDLHTSDVEEILVSGDDAYESAKMQMKLLVPSHVGRVKHYDEARPIFSGFNIDQQMQDIYKPQVKLKSGGSIVINQTEALVAIDVNSGKATRERDIEETAIKTNLEAVDEVARQLNLRDLAGLIVVDFIDMNLNRNKRQVEKRMKSEVRRDKARTQIGSISQFGLLEMSRQRLRGSVDEAFSTVCPQCKGTGRVRTVDVSAGNMIGVIEEIARKSSEPQIQIAFNREVALHLLNRMRDDIRQIEERHNVGILIINQDSLGPNDHKVVGDDVELDQSAGTSDSGRTSARGGSGGNGEQRPRKRSRRGGKGRRRHDNGKGETGPGPISQPAFDPNVPFAAATPGDDDEASGARTRGKSSRPDEARPTKAKSSGRGRTRTRSKDKVDAADGSVNGAPGVNGGDAPAAPPAQQAQAETDQQAPAREATSSAPQDVVDVAKAGKRKRRLGWWKSRD